MYLRTRNGGVIKTSEYHTFEDQVKLLTRLYKPIEKNEVILYLDFYFPMNNRDVDGGIKCLMDSLQGSIYQNDKQVSELHVRKYTDKKNPRVEVAVQIALDIQSNL